MRALTRWYERSADQNALDLARDKAPIMKVKRFVSAVDLAW